VRLAVGGGGEKCMTVKVGMSLQTVESGGGEKFSRSKKSEKRRRGGGLAPASSSNK